MINLHPFEDNTTEAAIQDIHKKIDMYLGGILNEKELFMFINVTTAVRLMQIKEQEKKQGKGVEKTL